MTTANEVRTACEGYNANPKSHDAQQELKRCLHGLRCIYLASDKIDTDRTVKLFEFLQMTSGTGRADAKTVADLLQSTTGALEASPYDGRPLFEGQTAEGVDYSKLPEDRRRWISFAMLTGEPIGSEQEAVDNASVPTLHFQRIGAKLKALEEKQPKTAEEERLLLDVRLRMQWTRDSKPAAVKAAPVDAGEAQGRPALRALLARACKTATDLDAFLLDYFPDVYRRTSMGMDRLTRENLLLQCHEEHNIRAALRAAGLVR